MKGAGIIVAGILAGSAAGLVVSRPAADQPRLSQATMDDAVRAETDDSDTGYPQTGETSSTFVTAAIEEDSSSGPQIISTSTLLGRQPPTKAPPVRYSLAPVQGPKPAAPARPAQRC